MTRRFYDPEILLEVASKLVKDANRKDRRASQKVLEGAVVALRGVVNHGAMPDEEQLIYVKFVLESLEKIIRKTHPLLPNDAFCWTVQSGPQKIRIYENFGVFLKIGSEYEIQKKSEAARPVERALKKIAAQNDYSWETLKKEVWQPLGGKKVWDQIQETIINPNHGVENP